MPGMVGSGECCNPQLQVPLLKGQPPPTGRHVGVQSEGYHAWGFFFLERETLFVLVCVCVCLCVCLCVCVCVKYPDFLTRAQKSEILSSLAGPEA